MSVRKMLRRVWLPVLVGCAGWVAPAAGQMYGSGPVGAPTVYGPYPPGASSPYPSTGAGPGYAQPAYRLADRTTASSTSSRPDLTRRPDEHPLMPAIRWAYGALKVMDDIHDYSATMVKRERINGKLGNYEYMFVKIRHKPMSAYMYFLDPPNLKGQEAIWVENRNEGKMSAHGVGFRKVFGTVSLEPTGPIAMQGNRYPITEVGILNLVRRLIEVGEKDAQYGECEVNFFPEAKINGRSCTCIQVLHPVPRRNFLFHLARIYVDNELSFPIRYEAYDWPKEQGGKPELLEEYTYVDIKLNNGYTDADFDTNNPDYEFTSAGRK